MGVRVVTDSAAALDDDVASRLGVTVVPIVVTFGGRSFPESDISLARVVAAGAGAISTAAPSPGAFGAAMEGAADGVVVVTVAARLSAAYRSATVAAGGAAHVRVIDSGTAAGGQALVIIHAARVAVSGATLAQTEAAARRAVARVRLVGALETLGYAAESGRVPGAVAGIVGRLGIRPMFALESGHVRRLRPASSAASAVRRLVARWNRTRIPGADLHLAVMHAMAPEVADQILTTIRAAVTPTSEHVGSFGAGMMAHTGPGVVGLAWWWDA